MLLAPELAAAHKKSLDQTLPVRGVKQFEPTGSWLETEQTSRALEERKSLIEAERVEKCSLKSVAAWIPDRSVAEVTRRVGKHLKAVGSEKNSVLILQPEEALFMVENNVLELKLGGVAMSVQQAYLQCLGSSCTIDEYRTYAKLMRLGMLVQRHNSSLATNTTLKRPGQESDTEPAAKRRSTNGPTECDNIEIIDLEADEPKKFPFVPNIIGKETVCIKAPPEDLIPSNIKPLKEYRINLKNLNTPGLGTRPIISYQNNPLYNLNLIQPSQINFPFPMQQQTLSSYYQSHFRNCLMKVKFMQMQEFVRCQWNFNQHPLGFPMPPRLHPYQQFSRFPNMGRPFVQQANQNLMYSMVMNMRGVQGMRPNFNRPTHERESANPQQALPKEREDLTPPPNPRVPKVKTKSWAQVKAKLANTIEIITLDDKPSDDYDMANKTVNQPIIQPEDCKSLDSILKKLQIFKKVSSDGNTANATNLAVKFDAFHPNPAFRKSNPGIPAYHVVIVSPMDVVTCSGPVGMNDVPILYAVAQPDTIHFYTHTPITLSTNDAS